MNRRTFLSLPAGLAYAAETAAATVTIDPARFASRIDGYGHFLEHVERVVYGGVFEPGSKFSDPMGLRLDVIDAIKEMGGARILRWPGGNFVSYYHWKDGIGPREKRPQRFSVVWREHESNQFGTDEYLALCRKLECEPFITANLGNGTIEEACEWVEYCRHADRKPPVVYWGLGNEHYGPWQVGHYTAREYGRKARQYGQFMRAVSPDIKLIGVGNNDEAWNAGVLEECGSLIDWLTIHLYGHRYFLDGVDDYDAITATPELFYRDMKAVADQLDAYEAKTPRQEPIRISLEEWNDRHFKTGGGTARNPGLIRESPRNIVDALFVCGVFNACHRLAPHVAMSNYVFILNAHGPLFAYPNGLLKTAVFDAFRLYATKMQPVAVPAEVTGAEAYSATFRWEGREQTARASRLDVSATRSPDRRKLAISLLNRDRTKPYRVALNVKGAPPAPGAVLHTLHSPDLLAVNSLAEPNKVRSVTRPLDGRVTSLDLLPHSVNILELSLS